VKKLFKCIKAHPLIKEWVLSQEYELAEADALEYVEKGYLEPIAVDEHEALVNRAVAKARQSETADRSRDVLEIVQQVIKGLDLSTGQHRGPQHVRIVSDDRDKRKNYVDFVSLVGQTGMSTSPRIQSDAREELFNVYAQLADETFDERWRKSHERADDVVIEKYIKSNGLRTTVSEYRKTALAEGSGTTGGYTVPPEYANDLLLVDPEDTALVGRTDDYVLTGRELRMPMLNMTGTLSAGQSNFFGGMVGQWTAEAATRVESEPSFKEIELVANEFSGYALASRNLLFDNKVALEQRLTRLFREMIAWYRDFAYIQGDGVGKPRGILNAPATLTVARDTASHIKYADICTMLGKFLPQSWKSGMWLLTQSALTDMLQLADTNGQLVIQPYFSSTMGPAGVKPVMQMLGIPVKVTEKLPALGTAGDLMLVDPKQYFTATRSDVEIAASDQYRFINNQIAYRYIFRGDGQPWLDGPITLQDQSTKISPFVKLIDH
jgi:HK97 family phage major capsid protein